MTQNVSVLLLSPIRRCWQQHRVQATTAPTEPTILKTEEGAMMSAVLTDYQESKLRAGET
ncbi:rCG37701 [Rattus norvegicus]|uniref:RCG37701 n=1 Tax=Rattus norvegicus TaxID=10116 RepID=A6JF82_RAT|nr:rCG37701 [Rattus norvegicus]